MARKIKKTRPYLELLESRRLLSIYADFNGDGFDDMAVGIVFEDLGTVGDAGAVVVIYGTASGLNATGSQVWTQDSTGITDAAEPSDHFGAALAGGDFNNDGFADLAIGAPGEAINGVAQAGAIHVIFGSASGLTAAKNQFFHQDSNRVREIGEPFDNFGSALAAGDFNNDGATDLAVGVPGEDVGSIVDAGGIQVFYGAHSGLTPAGGAQPFNLESPLVPGVATDNDFFGQDLSAGDFNGDGRDDLAIGINGFDPSGVEFGGAVCVMYGSTSGITASGSQLWNQDSPGITGGAEQGDLFGDAVAAGDFNNDGRSDLAIGVTGEVIGDFGFFAEGFVHVLYGSASGITATGSDAFDQSVFGSDVEEFDNFGDRLVAGDFNGDSRDDLAIAASGEDLPFNIQAGIVHVVFGSNGGINLGTYIEMRKDDTGTNNNPKDYDRFGRSMGAGDFDGDGKTDLAIASPGEDVNDITNAGRVYVVYGNTTTSFTRGETWDEATPGIPGGAEEDDQFGDGLDGGAGRSNDGNGKHEFAQLITADFELDLLLTRPNKRRFLSGRR